MSLLLSRPAQAVATLSTFMTYLRVGERCQAIVSTSSSRKFATFRQICYERKARGSALLLT